MAQNDGLAARRVAVVDAAEDVLVEYDPLPVVVDIEKALEEGSPLVHEQFGTNKVHEWSLGGGDLDAGFAAAAAGGSTDGDLGAEQPADLADSSA